MDADNRNGSDGMDAFTKMWMDFAGKMAQSGVAFSPDNMPPDAARKMRDMMLAAMGDYADQFMRSPQFLDAMRQSMNGAIQFRKQMNDFLANAQHEMQGASRQDIDQIIAAVQHVENRMVTSIDRLNRRLDDLEAKVSQNNGKPQSAGRPVRKSAKPARAPASAKANQAAKAKARKKKTTRTKRAR